MKLRLRGATVRLRVTRSEVERLAAGEVVVEEVPFAGAALRYALGVADVAEIDARFERGRVDVRLPRARAARWLDSDEVGLSATQGTLGILIEKDFACLKPRAGEDDGDAFPHPLAR